MSQRFKVSRRYNKRVTKARLIETQDVLEEIRGILTEDLTASLFGMEKLENYDSPKWEYKMADYLAVQRTYRKVIELLTIKES